MQEDKNPEEDKDPEEDKGEEQVPPTVSDYPVELGEGETLYDSTTGMEVTHDGSAYEHIDEGVNLGSWINFQRMKYSKLTKDQKEKLDLIEFKESIKKAKEKLIEICNLYKLDYNKNKFLVENISYQEMVAKINYLIEQKRIQDEQTSIKEDIYEFINRNIKIFEMTSANMKLILGIDKQELIQNYYTFSGKSPSRLS